MKRIFARAGVITTLFAVPAALPATAAAESHDATPPVYTYTATIDCGWGPMTVLSTDDFYAPLFDPSTGRSYQPEAWDVVYEGETIQDTRTGVLPPPARLLNCSYDDGEAAGTVTILRPHGHGQRVR